MPKDTKRLRCPKCASEGPFFVDAIATFAISEIGAVTFAGGTDWDSVATTACKACGYTGEHFTFEPND